VPQAPGTDKEHGKDESDEGDRREIGTRIHSPQGMPEPGSEVDMGQEAPEQLEAAEGGQSLASVPEMQIAVDTSAESRFSLPHCR
jgi:hypothetical protein